MYNIEKNRYTFGTYMVYVMISARYFVPVKRIITFSYRGQVGH